MRLAESFPDPPLLTLVGASAEWHAGTPPACAASVRLLDRVYFTVHRRDCIVVHHHDPAGARVFLAALAGYPALLETPQWVGQRHCVGQLRLRRCAVRTEVVASVLAGWHAAPAGAEPADGMLPHGAPVVHLLRASRDGYMTPDGERQWHRWAARERARGGAVVIVARAGEVAVRAGAARPARTARVSEPHEMVPGAGLPEGAVHQATVREVTLRHGRLRAWPR